MKYSGTPGSAGPSAAAAAEALVTIVPRAMRQIRGVARSAAAGLSVPQFRTLRYIDRHPGSGLTPVADHLGVSLSAASALVGRLVAAGLVERALDPTERRRVTIVLTTPGRERLAASADAVHAWWLARLNELSDDQLQALIDASAVLEDVLADADRNAGFGETT